MAYCGKCGEKVADNVRHCPICGTTVAGTEETTQNAAPTNPTADQTAKKVEDTIVNLNNTTDCTHEFDQKDIEQNKVMALLSYLGILILVPLLGAKGSKYARFHASQGVNLILLSIAYWAVCGIVTSVLYAISWRLYRVVNPILSLGNLAIFILCIIGIVNAVQGRAKDLPIIGKLRILKVL